MHHRIDELLFTALGIHHLHDHDLDAFEAQPGDDLTNVGDGFGLVFLNGDGAGNIAHHLAEDGGTHDHLLTLFQEGAEVGGEVRFAFAAVDDDTLALGSRRRAQFHVRRERGAAQADDTALTDLLDDGFAVLGNLGHQGVAAVDGLQPLVAFHGNLDVGGHTAGQVGPGGDGLDGTADGRVDVGTHEAAGLGDDLAHFHLVTHGHDRHGGRADVLGHGNIDGRGNRELLNGAIPGNLAVVRMNAADRESTLRHWQPPLLFVDGS